MSSTQRSFRLTTSAGNNSRLCGGDGDTPWQRFMGLMGRRELGADAGLCLRPCSSIHMFFMRFPLDVAFVDGDGRVVRLYHGLRPYADIACRPPGQGGDRTAERRRFARAGVGVGDPSRTMS